MLFVDEASRPKCISVIYRAVLEPFDVVVVKQGSNKHSNKSDTYRLIFFGGFGTMIQRQKRGSTYLQPSFTSSRDAGVPQRTLRKSSDDTADEKTYLRTKTKRSIYMIE